MALPKVIVFASGTKDGGGTAFENLALWSQEHRDSFDIVGVVSHHETGGIRMRADRLSVPFFYFPAPWSAERYQKLLEQSGAEWIALCGWLKLIKGLPPQKTFNMHPALLSQFNGRFGGSGMYWDHVHNAIHQAFQNGEIKQTGPSMHFVTDEYDRGPVFFEYPMEIPSGASFNEVKQMTIDAEHEWHPKITNLVVHGEIRWDGSDPTSLVVPPDFT